MSKDLSSPRRHPAEKSIPLRTLLCIGLALVCAVYHFTEHLNPSASRKSTYALEKLLLVPPNGQYIALRVLLQRGYSVRASFGVTEQQLKEVKLSLENPWLGRIVLGETRIAQLSD
jgi:hypothetical protein